MSSRSRESGGQDGDEVSTAETPGNQIQPSFGSRLQRLFGIKAAPPESSMEVGWRPYYSPIRSQNMRRIRALMETYGGEEDGVSWVFACLDLITQEASSWPWYITPLNATRIIPRQRVPQDLVDLIEQPNEDMTYSDFIQYLLMDEYLTGNSYWVKDQMNVLGQPLNLLRLRPEYTQIAISESGRVIGYVYNPPDFPLPIPFNRDEVVHFKRGPNPRSEYYGMSVVEGIHGALEADLAETEHVIGFFADGARISGVLTTNTLSEVQFERFRQQFAEEYAGAANAHKILIVEEGTKFDPITSVPGSSGSGVKELRSMTKDEILSAFGVPSPMLGGTLTESTYKMEESQDIFSRRMFPLASRISQRFTLDVTTNWQLAYKIDQSYAEPRDHKVDRAGNMLKAGATINDARREMNLPPHNEDWADVPVVPQGFAPFGFMTPGGAPSSVPVAPGGNVNGNNPSLPNTEPASVPQLAQSAQARLPAGKFIAPKGFEDLAGQKPEIVEYGEGVDCLAKHIALIEKTEIMLRMAYTQHLLEVGQSASKSLGHLQFRSKKTGKVDFSVIDVWPLDSDLGKRIHDVIDQVAETTGREWDPVGPREMMEKDRMVSTTTDIDRIARAEVTTVISEGKRRSYSYSQIQAGFPDEGYAGVVTAIENVAANVDEVVRDHAVKIANMVTLISYRNEGVSMVEVIDGDQHPECLAARNVVWSVVEAIENLAGRPGCTRMFLPIR